MIFSNKVIENIRIGDIENIIKDIISCKDDSIKVNDIKLIIDVKMELQEKINNYRDERVKKYISENEKKCNVIFHAIPLDAFLKSRIDFKKFKKIFKDKQFFNSTFSSNFEGLYDNNGLFEKKLFRNGILEVISADKYRDEIDLSHSFKEFKNFVNESLDGYKELNILCPIVYFVTFTNVKGCGKMGDSIDSSAGDCDLLNPVGVAINDKQQVDLEAHNIFVPIWNYFENDVDYMFDASEKNNNQ